MIRSIWFGTLVGVVCCSSLLAEDWKPIPRVLPPIGISIPDSVRQEIESGLKKLRPRVEQLRERSDVGNLAVDVEIYLKALQYSVDDQEFYSEKDFKSASAFLATAEKRIAELEKGQHDWTTAHGLIVRGYHSKIDGTAQPYGLEIPEKLDLSKPVPLYVWLHGRGDKETDFYFIRSHESRKGQIHPDGAIVMHAFGRNCLGFKSAGETDVFEAIDAVKRHYKIDADRVVLAGFSMGGAGAWHLGAHFTDQFCVIHTGAGFIDVAKYRHLKPEDYPVWYEQKLWGQYDVPDYLHNLFNANVISYSGEVDAQRASAEIMAGLYRGEGRTLTHLIGPKMPHKYDPAVLAEVMKLIAAGVEKGRNNYPHHVLLQTRTLRYNRQYWVDVRGLGEHWEDSQVQADVVDPSHITVATKNITSLRLFSPWKETGDRAIEVKIDGAATKTTLADLHAGNAYFYKTPAGWDSAKAPAPSTALQKSPGLQGPIDDAFVEPFLVVVPSKKSENPAVAKWVDFELSHFRARWRGCFRGNVRVKNDLEVTPEDIAAYHLVLWGDPGSNSVMAKVIGNTPIVWTAKEVGVGEKKFDAATRVPVAIYPNPLNPTKYIVLNSGPTFREAHDHTNSLQNPKLPDWAILDIAQAPDAAAAGAVQAADFFDESWQVKRGK